MNPTTAGASPEEEPGFGRWLDRLAKRQGLFWAVCLAFIAAIAVIDWLTGDVVLLYMAYILPVAMLAWGGGARAALIGSLLATGIVLVTYVSMEGGKLHGHLVWRSVATLSSTLALGWTVARLKTDHLRMTHLLEEERRLAREDSLTSVASSRAFHERLALEIERMKRHRRPLGLIYLDLDDFKKVNDEHGHMAGNEQLARVGRLLIAAVRKVDLAGRLGGDEFAVLMPEIEASDAMQVALRVKESLNRAYKDGGASASVSLGLATFLTAPLDSAAAINVADQLMFKAKNAGKNQIMSKGFD